MGLIHYPVVHHIGGNIIYYYSMYPSLQVTPKPSHLLAPCPQVLQFPQQDLMVNCVKSLFDVILSLK